MKILVVAPAWVGDMVVSHSLIRVLGAERIDVLAPPSTAPLAERMPGVARVHVLPVGHGELALGVRRHVAKALRTERFDQAIVLPNTFKSGLVPLFARVPRRTGWHGEFRYGVLNDRRRLQEAAYPRLVDRYVALGLTEGARLPSPLPLPELERDAAKADALRVRFALPATGPVLALCPGAEYGPAKRWPARYFVEVALHQLRTKRAASVWLFGTARDGDITLAVQRALAEAGYGAHTFDLAGRTSLIEAVDLLAVADHVVTNDSGLMHVACALGRRVVAIYGSTSPEYTPPLGATAKIVRDPPPCSPCFERVCPFGHTKCLEDLAPARVIAALEGAT